MFGVTGMADGIRERQVPKTELVVKSVYLHVDI